MKRNRDNFDELDRGVDSSQYGDDLVPRRHPVLRFLFKICFLCFLACAIALTVWGYFLDREIRAALDSSRGRWHLPALVYARPLELSLNERITPEQMERELRLLHYRKAGSTMTQPGQYAIRKQGNAVNILIFRRNFDFYNSPEPERHFLLTFRDGKLAALRECQENNCRNLVSALMEPVLLDRITGKGMEDRMKISIDDVPEELIYTLVNVEDRDFFSHGGIDVSAILRALFVDIIQGGRKQGASTLTQQFVKNYFLSNEKTLSRKLKEAVMAVIIDARYSKKQILEFYMNEIYMGQSRTGGIYGYALASQFYFGRPLKELNQAQLAFLAGLVKAPSLYDPWRHNDKAKERRDVVLRVLCKDCDNKESVSVTDFRDCSRLKDDAWASCMQENADKFALGRSDYEMLTSLDLKVIPRSSSRTFKKTPAFMEYVNREVAAKLGDDVLKSSGVRIFTSLDPLSQNALEEAVQDTSAPWLSKQPIETAAVVTDWKRGEVVAVVGSSQVNTSGLFNRALDQSRQIGSLMKPAVYLTSFSHGFNLGTVINDTARTFSHPGQPDWTPKNFDKKYHGPVYLYRAFARSLNVPAAAVCYATGVKNVKQTLLRLGVPESKVSTIDDHQYSIVLGTIELTPLEVSQMFVTIANLGRYQPLGVIRAVTSSDGDILYQREDDPEEKVTEVLDPADSYSTVWAMTRVVAEGTGRRLGASFPGKTIAAKTGTTDSTRDSWFAGFDDNEAAVVWVGRDDNKPTGFTGGTGALRIYESYLKKRGVTSLRLNPPETIRDVRFSSDGHALAESCSGAAVTLPVREGMEGEIEDCSEPPVMDVFE